MSESAMDASDTETPGPPAMSNWTLRETSVASMATRATFLALFLILGVVDLLRRCTLRRLLVFGGGGGGPGGVGVGSRSVSQRSAEGRRRVTHVARHGAAGGRPAGRHGRPWRRQRGPSLRYGHIRPLFSSLNRPLHSWIFPLWSSISTLSLD